jgi:hypothetical protein
VIFVKSIEDPLPFIAPGSLSQKNRENRTGVFVALPNAYQIHSGPTMSDHEKAIGVAYMA